MDSTSSGQIKRRAPEMLVASVAWLILAAGTHGMPRGLADEPRAASDDVAVLRDVPYCEGASAKCKLDLAVPKSQTVQARPAIVVIHGGGWLEGDKSSFSTTTNRAPANILDFAALGFVSATINYRLSGDAPFPAALEDCQCALGWLRAHADEYHIDANRIGAYGNSAGGHLALLLGMMPKADDAPNAGNRPPRLVQAVVSDSGPVDLAAQHGQNQLREVIERFMGGPPDGPRADLYKRASPMTYALAREQLPPLLLMHGEADTQVDVKTADEFVAALSRSGHKNLSYLRLANVDHCPHSLIRLDYLPQVVNEFFARHLKLERAKR